MNVDKNRPSAAAGIRPRRRDRRLERQKLSGVRALLRSLGPDSVGSVVDVAIRRGGEPTRSS